MPQSQSDPAVEMVAVADLHFADYNPRVITAEMMGALKRSLVRFGMPSPVVVNRRNRVIVGGEQRTRAAIALGWPEVPVSWVDLSPEEERAMNVALNSIGGEFVQDRLDTVVRGLCAVEPELADDLLLRDLVARETVSDGTLRKISMGGDDQLPELAWALIGVPVSRWGEVAPLVEQAARVSESIVETTITGGKHGPAEEG